MLRKTSRNDITTSIKHILKLFNIYIYERIGFFIGNKKILALKVFKTMTKQVHTKYTNKAQKKLVCKEEKKTKSFPYLTNNQSIKSTKDV